MIKDCRKDCTVVLWCGTHSCSLNRSGSGSSPLTAGFLKVIRTVEKHSYCQHIPLVFFLLLPPPPFPHPPLPHTSSPSLPITKNKNLLFLHVRHTHAYKETKRYNCCQHAELWHGAQTMFSLPPLIRLFILLFLPSSFFPSSLFPSSFPPSQYNVSTVPYTQGRPDEKQP